MNGARERHLWFVEDLSSRLQDLVNQVARMVSEHPDIGELRAVRVASVKEFDAVVGQIEDGDIVSLDSQLDRNDRAGLECAAKVILERRSVQLYWHSDRVPDERSLVLLGVHPLGRPGCLLPSILALLRSPWKNSPQPPVENAIAEAQRILRAPDLTEGKRLLLALFILVDVLDGDSIEEGEIAQWLGVQMKKSQEAVNAALAELESENAGSAQAVRALIGSPRNCDCVTPARDALRQVFL